MARRINLSDDGASYITIDTLPEDLKTYGANTFDTLFNLHPKERGKVQMQTGEIESPRWHKSYLNTPTHNPELQHSYMFSGRDDSANRDPLPHAFLPFLDYVNRDKAGYNQVVVNWYKDGQNFTPQHSDCEEGMEQGADIVIVSLGDERVFKIRAKHLEHPEREEALKIPLPHGSVVTMGGQMQKLFRHGVPKADSENPRISITFRKFKTQ